ncbi:hypothetical protein VaNZ11_013891 [Volvox africanus]|uniref:SBP-type domain-containing protein n=1 Tax=Volvox africanus TaxID=51714 RepID=A0ABQ5SH89_9CHLO|nr:hypothetical protein VaNZ11_013891 [Volvox africanus]
MRRPYERQSGGALKIARFVDSTGQVHSTEPAASPPGAAMAAAAATAAAGASGGKAVGGNVPDAAAAPGTGSEIDSIFPHSHGRHELKGSTQQPLSPPPPQQQQQQPPQQPGNERNHHHLSHDPQRRNRKTAEQRRQLLQQESQHHSQSHLQWNSPQKQQERQCSTTTFQTPWVDKALRTTAAEGVAIVTEAVTSAGDRNNDIIGQQQQQRRQPPSPGEPQQPQQHQHQEWQRQQSQGFETAGGGADAETEPRPDASSSWHSEGMSSDGGDSTGGLAAAVAGKSAPPPIRDVGASLKVDNNAFGSCPSRPVASPKVSGPRSDLELNMSATETTINGGSGRVGRRHEKHWRWHLTTGDGGPTGTAEGLQKRKVVGSVGGSAESLQRAAAVAAATLFHAAGTVAATHQAIDSPSSPSDEDGDGQDAGGCTARKSGDLQQQPAVGQPAIAAVGTFHKLQRERENQFGAAVAAGGSDGAAEGYNTDDDSDEEFDDEFDTGERHRRRTTPPPSTAPDFKNPHGYGDEEGRGVSGSPLSPAGRHLPSPVSRSSALGLAAGEAARLAAAGDNVELAANKGVGGAGRGMSAPTGTAGRGVIDAVDPGDSQLVAVVAATATGTSHIPVAVGNETQQHQQTAPELRPVQPQQQQMLLPQHNALAEDPSSPGVEDAVVQERRGRHKGLICCVRDCNKFARLTNTGLRRYCIQHMRQHGFTPKSYESRNQNQQRYQPPQHASGDGGCSGGLPSGNTIPTASAYQGPGSGGSGGAGAGAGAGAAGCGELLSHAFCGGGRHSNLGGDDSFTSQHGQLHVGAPNVAGGPLLDELASTYRLRGASQLPYSSVADDPVIPVPAIPGATATAAGGGTSAIDSLNATVQRHRHLQSLPVLLVAPPVSDAGLGSGPGAGSGRGSCGGGGTPQPLELQKMPQGHVLPPGPCAPNPATTAVMIDGGGVIARGSVHMPAARGPSAGSLTQQQHLEELRLLGVVTLGNGDTDTPASVITGMGGGSGIRPSASLPFATPLAILKPQRGHPSVGGAGIRSGGGAAATAAGPEGSAVLRARAAVSAGHMMVVGIETAHAGGAQEGEGGQQRSSSVNQQARVGSGAVDARIQGRSVSTEPVTTGQPSAKRIRTADGHFAIAALSDGDGGCAEAAAAAAAAASAAVVEGVAAVSHVPPGTSNTRAAGMLETAIRRSGGDASPDAAQDHAGSFLGLQHQLLLPGGVAGTSGDSAAAAAALGGVSRQQLGIRVVDVDSSLMPAVVGLVRAAGLLGGRQPPILLQAANCRDTLLPPPPPPGTLRTLFQTADGRILPGRLRPVNALVDGDVEIEDVIEGQKLNPRTRGSLGAAAAGVNIDCMLEYEDAWDELLDAAARRRGSAPAPVQPQRLAAKSESNRSGLAAATAVAAVTAAVLASGVTYAAGPAESEQLMSEGDAAGEPMRPENCFQKPKQQQQQHPWQLPLQLHPATGRQSSGQEFTVPSHIVRGPEGTAAAAITVAAAAGEQVPAVMPLIAGTGLCQQSPRELDVKPHGGRGQLYQSPQEHQQRAPEQQQQQGYRPSLQKCSDLGALREEIQQHLEHGPSKQELQRQLQRRQGLTCRQQKQQYHHHLSGKELMQGVRVKEQNTEPNKESLGPVICSTDSLPGRSGDVSHQRDAKSAPCVRSERFTPLGREVVGTEPVLGAVAPLRADTSAASAGGAIRGPFARPRVDAGGDCGMQISDDDNGRRLGSDGDGSTRGVAANSGDGSHGRGLILCAKHTRGRRSQPPLPRPPAQPFRQARCVGDDATRAGNDDAIATAAATDAAAHGDVANAISSPEDEDTTAGRRRDAPTLLSSLPRADLGDRYALQPVAGGAGGWDKGRQPPAEWAFSEHQLQLLQQSRGEMATGYSNMGRAGNTAASTRETDNHPWWTSHREQQRQQQQERHQQEQDAVAPAATLPRAHVLLGPDGSLVIVDPSDGVVLAETPAAAAAEALSDLAPTLGMQEYLRQYRRQQASQQRARVVEIQNTESGDGNPFRSTDRAAASGGGGRSSGSGGGGYASHSSVSRQQRSPPRGGGGGGGGGVARTNGTLLGDAAPPSPPPAVAVLADASSTGNLESIFAQSHQQLNRRRLVYDNTRGLNFIDGSSGGGGAARGGGDWAACDSDSYYAFAQRPPLPPRPQTELLLGCVGAETQLPASAVRPPLSLQLTPLSPHQSVVLQQKGRQIRETQQPQQHQRIGRAHPQQPEGREPDGGYGQSMQTSRAAEDEAEAGTEGSDLHHAALALSQLGVVAGRPRSAPSGLASGPVQETVDDDVVEVDGR